VEKGVAASGKTEKLILRGGGWGHGVGICQVGAAVMAEQGFTCEEILNHYYKSTELKKIYD
jgi:SpoIID/LytB domain protein